MKRGFRTFDGSIRSGPDLGSRAGFFIEVTKVGIPPPGSKLTREFRGVTVSVKFLRQGFEYRGQQYRSLSAIANEVAGTRWNGLHGGSPY